jgi:carboxymethylenebutenolidase
MTQSYPGTSTSYVTFADRVNAFLAIPADGTGPFGAVILGHERYGLVQHTLDLTAKLAASGYVGIAPDMYSRWDGDKEALSRGDIMVPICDDDIRSYMGASLDYLLQHSQVDPKRIAAMGVCQSGEYPLVLNSTRHEICANVVVYGGAQAAVWELGKVRQEPYEDIISRVTAPVLGIFGEDDFVVSVEDMRRLRAVLEGHRKSYEFTLFPHMPHGWMNSTMPGRYRPAESKKAWGMIIDFLERVSCGSFPSDRTLWSFRSDIAPDYDFTKKVRLA